MFGYEFPEKYSFPHAEWYMVGIVCTIGAVVMTVVVYCCQGRRILPKRRPERRPDRRLERRLEPPESAAKRERRRRASIEREQKYRVEREQRQEFFLKEVNMGEKQILRDDHVSGVEHFANALMACDEPLRLWDILEQTLPRPAYSMLIVKMGQYQREPPAHLLRMHEDHICGRVKRPPQ